ncbi:MAG: mechanosensitive ion channel family protein [Hydrogenibacillus sp.]|nr:mechanosensitive ion channel family protein [Hydrogenibacillus sp.]
MWDELWYRTDLSAMDFIDVLRSVGIFVAFYVARVVFERTIGRHLARYAERNGEAVAASLIQAFGRPLRVLWSLIGLYLALIVLGPPLWLKMAFQKIVRVVILVFVAWGFYNLTDRSAEWVRRLGMRHGVEFRTMLLPLISHVFRFLVLAVAFTVLLQEFGYRIDSLIAGLGLGGLAVSLAAKDTLSNLFGGAVILFEKTFAVGDWIETPAVSGTVEEITIRSTKIRTFDQGLVIIPNSLLVGGAIKNWSKMGKRRILFNLPLEIGTSPERIARLVGRLKNDLLQDPDVHPDGVYVAFEQFAESSLSVLISFFTRTTKYDEWLAIKERINLHILRLLEAEGVRLAVPSRTVYVRADEPGPTEAMKDNRD